MATALKRSGGPKTAKGKLSSSKNAIKHGLTAKRWLNEDEQYLYDELLELFTDDYKPQTYIERSLVAQLAECQTRLNRIHSAEDAMFALAREQSDNPLHTIESFQTNDPELDAELNEIIYRSSVELPNHINANSALYKEIANTRLNKVSGWRYVCNELPLLRNYILDKCEDLQEDVATYLGRQPGAMIIRLVGVSPSGNDDPEEPGKTRDELEKTAHKVSANQLTRYIEDMLKQVRHKTILSRMAQGFAERQELVKKTALPDVEKQNQINRYRKEHLNQFSKALAQLITLQKHRREI